MSGLDLDGAAAALERGEVVAVPTDTVWGLAARLDRPDAIAQLFVVKGRPSEVAVPVLVAGVDAARALVGDLDPVAASLMAEHWPGALTVVVDCPPSVAAATGATATVGLRAPAAPQLLALLERTGPLATTSCNRHGLPPVTTAAEAAALLDGRGGVLDGDAGGGVSSTVVAVRRGWLHRLRSGPVALADRVVLREGSAADATDAAAVLADARRAAFPMVPPSVHDDVELAPFLERCLAEGATLTLAELGGEVVGVSLTSAGTLDQLAVRLGSARRGIGTALLADVVDRSPGGLSLWTFESNVVAQRFYESFGFTVAERTDGDNEEGAPDRRYVAPPGLAERGLRRS